MSNPTLAIKTQAIQPLATTGDLSGLATNALVVGTNAGASGVFSNLSANIGSTGAAEFGGYPFAYLEFDSGSTVWGSAPTANTSVDGWFLTADDGTNYEIGGASVTPGRAPDFSFAIIAQTARQIVKANGGKLVEIPAVGKFKALIRNNGTGQSLPATSVINIIPATEIYPSV